MSAQATPSRSTAGAVPGTPAVSIAPRGLAVVTPAAPVVKRNRSELPQPSHLRGMLTATPKPLNFVLPGLVRATVGAVIGPGGVGKSFWAMQTAISMAAGVDLVGIKPKRGSVLYLSAEDFEEVHAERMRAMTAGAPKDLDLSDGLDLRVLTGLNVDVMESEWYVQILEAALGRDLVIFDTLTRFHSLDENSALDMKKLLAQLERLAEESGAAVLYLHHTSKAAAVSGMGGTQQAARGSSVLVDNARWACFLAQMTPEESRRLKIPEEQRQNYVRWNISKQNYGAAIPDVWFQRSAGGVLRTHGAPVDKGVPIPELVKLPTDPVGRLVHHVASSRGARAIIKASDSDAVIARGLNADSTTAERTAHAQAMEVASGRPPKTATGAYEGNW